MVATQLLPLAALPANDRFEELRTFRSTCWLSTHQMTPPPNPARFTVLGINSRRLVLAGDSAGAQIAAQTAAVLTNPDYARLVGIAPGVSPDQIAGTLLHCGVYDISGMGKEGGVLGWFVQSAGWAYSGKRNWRQDKLFQTMSIAPHIVATFPPAFVSAGNADPLGPQSVAIAQALKTAGVDVEELFFPKDYQPALGHEYQFDVDTQAGRMALTQSVDWLNSL